MPENENIEELTVLKSVEKILAILVTLTVIITRFDMVKGLWLNGFLLLLCICLLCLYRKQIPRILLPICRKSTRWRRRSICKVTSLSQLE